MRVKRSKKFNPLRRPLPLKANWLYQDPDGWWWWASDRPIWSHNHQEYIQNGPDDTWGLFTLSPSTGHSSLIELIHHVQPEATSDEV